MAAQAVETTPAPGAAGEVHPAFAQILGRLRRPGAGRDDHAR